MGAESSPPSTKMVCLTTTIHMSAAFSSLYRYDTPTRIPAGRAGMDTLPLRLLTVQTPRPVPSVCLKCTHPTSQAWRYRDPFKDSPIVIRSACETPSQSDPNRGLDLIAFRTLSLSESGGARSFPRHCKKKRPLQGVCGQSPRTRRQKKQYCCG